MEATPPERLLPFNLDLLFRRRLGRMLLLCLLGLTLLPIALMGFFSCQTAAKGLEQETGRRVHLAAEWERSRLTTVFDGSLSGAPTQGRTPGPASGTDTVAKKPAAPTPDRGSYRYYLVDADLTLMAGSIGGRPATGETLPETELTRLWDRKTKIGMAAPSLSEPIIYSGPAGKQVMGVIVPLQLDQKSCALIVETDMAAVFRTLHWLRTIVAATAILTAMGVVVVSAILVQRILNPIQGLSQRAFMAVDNQMKPVVEAPAGNEIDELARSVERLIEHLNKIENQCEAQMVFIAGLTELHQLIGGEQELDDLNLNTLEFLCDTLDLSRADFYIVNKKRKPERIGRFPGHPNHEARQALSGGEARAARAVREKTSHWFRKEASSGPPKPVLTVQQANLTAMPLMLDQTVNGVLELEKEGFFTEFDGRFAEAAAEIVSVALNAAVLRRQERSLLDQSQRQAAALKARESALQTKTQELQDQTLALQTSEESLQLKQLELQAANAQMVKNAADLEAHMTILEKQKKDIQKQNRELANAHRDLAEKARQLEISSQYKTEFMANMSHELRTPLNSILLLSRLLLENKEKTLAPRQSEFARTIHSAGEDLLHLINEILDLAKVEAGKMEADFAPVKLRAITRTMLVSFSPLAEQSGVAFDIHVAPDVPDVLVTDRKRLEQIVKNFLSNAFKFTTAGSIRLEIATAADGHANGADTPLTISVVDTGIGIPAAKQGMVFEAFQQVDGSIRRKYGGTGLGLSISRELAKMLGGEIKLESEDGLGSRFTLHLPLNPLQENEPAIVRREIPRQKPPATLAADPADRPASASTAQEYVPDDRNRLVPGDSCILIMETEVDTIEAIQAHAHEAGYKVLVAEQFPTGLHFADYHRPAAIFLNLELIDGKGWEMVARIKNNPASRHIPVFTMSPVGNMFEAACHGAADHVAKPVDSERLESPFALIAALRSVKARTILVAAPDREQAALIAATIEGPNTRAIAATTAADANAALESNEANAVIVHPAMVSAGQHEFLHRLEYTPTPVFQYSGSPLTKNAWPDAGPFADKLNIQGVDTPEQLLAAIVGSLHLPPDGLKKNQLDRLESMDNRIHELKGRKVLLVDDDMRTVFAVSNVLEDLGVTVITGKTGKESLDKLNGFPDIDLVLMDVMISGVDGYQAIRAIRDRKRYAGLTIIALTAKAMRGDRSKCIQAGADDYLAKPVNLDKLTSMLKTWFKLARSASQPIEI